MTDLPSTFACELSAHHSEIIHSSTELKIYIQLDYRNKEKSIWFPQEYENTVLLTVKGIPSRAPSDPSRSS